MSKQPKVEAPKPWVAAIHRLLKAELRLDPRPKPGRAPQRIYWNGQDLAIAADIRPNTLSDAMTGKREPSLSTLQAIATALGVPAAALLMDTEEAEAYVVFRQNQTASASSMATEDAVRRVLKQQAEHMAAAWVDTQTKTVLAELTGSPAPQQAIPQVSATTGNLPPAEVARGRLQRKKVS